MPRTITGTLSGLYSLRSRVPWNSRTKSLLCVVTLALLPFLVFWRLTAFRLNPFRGDVLTYYYPMQYFIRQQIRQGLVPLWNNRMFSGMPLATTSSSLYPPNLLFMLLPAWVSATYSLLFHLSLAGVFMFLYTRALGIGRKGAFVAGLTFMFCGFSIAHFGHHNIIRTVPWLPLILWAVERWRQRFELKYVGVGAVATGFMLLGGHPQIPLYALAIVAAYLLFFVLFPDPPGHRWKFLSGGMGMVGLGLLIASPLLWDLYQKSRSFQRPIPFEYEYEVFSSFSLPPVGLAHLLFPRAMIDIVNQTEMVGYIGILPLALAILAAFRWRHKVKGLLLVIAGFSLVLALGRYTPLNQLMFHVPIYNSFRAPARNLFVFDFASAVLAGAGLHCLVTAQSSVVRRLSRWTWGLVAGLIALGVAIPAILAWGFPELIQPLLADDRSHALTSQAIWLPLVIILASSAVLLVIARRPRRLGPIILASALIVADLYFSFAAPNLSGLSTQQPPSEVFAEASDHSPSSVEFLKRDRSLYRIVSYSPSTKFDPQENYDLLTPNLNLLYDIDSADAYNGGTVPARYRAFTNDSLVGEGYTALIGPDLFRSEQHEILNLLNVKYVVVPVNIDHRLWSETVVDVVSFDASHLPGLNLGAAGLVSTTLNAPAYPVTELVVASALTAGEGLKDGEPVARIVLTDETGRTSTHQLLAGEHVAGIAYDCDPGIMKHQKAPLAYDLPSGRPCPYHIYFARFQLGTEPATIRQIELGFLPSSGALLVSRISLYDARTSTSYPTSVTQGYLAYLSQGKAYRLVYEGDNVRIYENTHVLPRAFLATDVELVSSAEEADDIVHQGAFPDGSRFFPRAVALVEAPIPESPPAGGSITLHAYPIEPGFWTGVQWRDAQGNWHEVASWQAPFDDQNQVAWGVAPDDLGKGPFRWAIHESQGGSLVAASDPFNLPASADEAVRVQLPLLWPTGVQPSTASELGDRLGATVTSAQAGHMEIQTESDQNAFLVYSENYFPGWKASLDGQPVEIHRTDGTLLGVPVPAGQHTIVLTYRPPTLYLTLLSTLVTLSIVIGLVSTAVRQVWRRSTRP